MHCPSVLAFLILPSLVLTHSSTDSNSHLYKITYLFLKEFCCPIITSQRDALDVLEVIEPNSYIPLDFALKLLSHCFVHLKS